jgi:acyl-CoA synthetase (AMP-forming)/AMP-acid ligase II
LRVILRSTGASRKSGKTCWMPREYRTPPERFFDPGAKIAGYKSSRDVTVIVELPKTSTGKIQKFVLRDKERAGQASA